MQDRRETCTKAHVLQTRVQLDHGQGVCGSDVSSRVQMAVFVRALKTSALWPRAVHSKQVKSPSWKLA